jgi:hypothetical protein
MNTFVPGAKIEFKWSIESMHRKVQIVGTDL